MLETMKTMAAISRAAKTATTPRLALANSPASSTQRDMAGMFSRSSPIMVAKRGTTWVKMKPMAATPANPRKPG
ncbi:hypothetical protein D3C77_785530 [compost metagenome]